MLTPVLLYRRGGGADKGETMTEMDVIKKLARWVDSDKYPYQVCNAFIYDWECDYWAMDERGITREFEIKISRSDYLADSKKKKHLVGGGANYFYYVVPEGLVAPSEVDKKYGLIYVPEIGPIKIVKKPRELHSNRFDNWRMLANKMYWRYRQLWREKYTKKEITRDELWAGFNLTLEEIELPNDEVCDATDDASSTGDDK